MTPAEVDLLDQIATVALLGPGDIGCFHAANYHAASNDCFRASATQPVSAALYAAVVPWAGVRRLCASCNYWSG